MTRVEDRKIVGRFPSLASKPREGFRRESGRRARGGRSIGGEIVKLVSRRSKVVKSRGSFRCSKKKLDKIASAWMCILILIDRGVLVEEKKKRGGYPSGRGSSLFPLHLPAPSLFSGSFFFFPLPLLSRVRDYP